MNLNEFVCRCDPNALDPASDCESHGPSGPLVDPEVWLGGWYFLADHPSVGIQQKENRDD